MDVQMSLGLIADLLKMPIKYEDGAVSGSADMLYCPLPSLEIPVKLTVSKLFANDAVGVVVHVLGDLYLVVSHLAKTGAINVFMVDGSRLTLLGEKTSIEALVCKTMTIKQVVLALHGAVAVAFLRKDLKWSVLKLPS